MTIQCAVACRNASGEPDFFTCEVELTKREYDEGEHYDAAREMARQARYEGPYVVFDENDMPRWMYLGLFRKGERE